MEVENTGHFSPVIPSFADKGLSCRLHVEAPKGEESNGNLPLRNCLECSVPEPYRSPDWALVPAKTGLRAILMMNDDDEHLIYKSLNKYLYNSTQYLSSSIKGNVPALPGCSLCHDGRMRMKNANDNRFTINGPIRWIRYCMTDGLGSYTVCYNSIHFQ